MVVYVLDDEGIAPQCRFFFDNPDYFVEKGVGDSLGGYRNIFGIVGFQIARADIWDVIQIPHGFHNFLAYFVADISCIVKNTGYGGNTHPRYSGNVFYYNPHNNLRSAVQTGRI